MENKNLIIITGTGSGIGHALAEKLIQNPENTVIGISRKNELNASNFQFINIDLTQIEHVKEFQFPQPASFQNICLVNNAGMLGEINTMDKISLESIENIVTVNYTSAMIMSNLFIQAYQDFSSTKTLIQISSGAAYSPYASWANYCATKAALDMFSKCINVEQENLTFPIRSLSIAPGVVNTPMQQYIRDTDINNFAMKPKFEALYSENQLYKPNLVAEKLEEIIYYPERFEENQFRIII